MLVHLKASLIGKPYLTLPRILGSQVVECAEEFLPILRKHNGLLANKGDIRVPDPGLDLGGVATGFDEWVDMGRLKGDGLMAVLQSASRADYPICGEFRWSRMGCRLR